MSLFGCPFCRELYSEEEARVCAECGVDLVPLARLPLSYEAKAEQAALLQATPLEDRTLPFTYWRRGRGALVLLAVLGLGAFFAPWVELKRPISAVLSGYDLARAQAGWFWGGAVAWFVMIPLVLTRRTIHKMRGVRIITAAFASMTLLEVVMLVLNAPEPSPYRPVEMGWSWGLYASGLISAVGVAVAIRFGGRLDDIALPASDGSEPDGWAEASPSRTLH